MNNLRIFFFVCLINTSLWAQNRKYVNQFLEIGVGARALGMGTATLATSTDVTGGYWNPACLTNLNEPFQVSLMHASYFSGIANYDYGGMATRISPTQAFGITLLRFAVDNIPNTFDLIGPGGEIRYDRIRKFSISDFATLISYAQKTRNEKASFGGSAKIIRRKIGSFAHAWGFGTDFGYHIQKDDWYFSAVGKDITFTFTGWTMTLTDAEKAVLVATGNEVPKSSIEINLPRIEIGVAKKIEYQENHTFMPEATLRITQDGARNTLIATSVLSIQPVLGFEYGYKKTAFLRCGVQNFQRQKNLNEKTILTLQPTVGAGIQFKTLTLDYAFTDLGNASAALYSHIISLKLGIGPSQENNHAYSY